VADEFDIVVIGGGIAGLSAGVAAARAGHKTMILIGAVLGGHLVMIEQIDGVPGYDDGVAGYELCPNVQMQAAEAGAAFAMEEAQLLESADDCWRIKTAAKEYTARAVILATGTTLKTLGIPGEERLVGKGVSHCASCDAPLMRGKPVVVVGGGDSACQEALTLAPHVSKVTLVTDGDRLTAQALYADPVRANPKFEFLYSSTIEEIVGEAGVTAVRVRRDGGDTVDVDAHGVFIFVGLEGNSKLVAGLVTPDAAGRVPVDENMRTTLPGLFAAGTIRQNTTNRAAPSAQDGEKAASAAALYIDDGVWRDGIT
jgi:thioredoxin reductase (NADPH)